MKINKTIYIPIASVLVAIVLFVADTQHKNWISQPYQDTTFTFEPELYFATVIQVGGVGSDIYTNRAYYIGDGTDSYQEGWPNYLDKDTYALVSFNTPFYLMTLSCKDGYKATLLPNETSDPEAYSDTESSFTIRIKEKIKNELSIKCKKGETSPIRYFGTKKIL